MGNVSDCYILHSQNLEGPFAPFKFFAPLPVIYESDEDKDAQQLVAPNENPAVYFLHEKKNFSGKFYLKNREDSD